MEIISKVTREKLYNRNYNRDGLELIKNTPNGESKKYIARLLVNIKREEERQWEQLSMLDLARKSRQKIL